MDAVRDTKHALYEGNCVVLGFMVYPNFYRTRHDGKMRMPLVHTGPVGGHAILVVGYDDPSQCLICRNSWGRDWGADGYFYMPYAFARNANYVFDVWSIKKI